MGFSRKNKRAAKKAARTATSRVEKLSGSAQSAAQDGISKFSDTVVPAVTEGAKEAKAKASDLVDQYLPQVQDAVHTQGEKLSDLADKLGPRAEKLRHEIQDDYLPRARRTAGATNAVVATAVTAAVDAAVDAARKELDKGQADIKAAYTKPVKKKGRAGKVLLLIALASAGAAAGYVVWKRSRPVEDPWAPPADFARAHYPSAGATDTDSTEVSDSVGGAEAGDVAQSLGAKTPDRTSDTTPHDVKVDHAEGADAAGTHRAEGEAETGKVIDPVLNPDENPADPKRGNHRSDS